MNRILKKLTNEMYSIDLDYYYRKIGNYKVKRNKYFIEHFYYDNKICKVYLYNKKFYLFDCGYNKYRLTTAQLNFLEEYYKSKGYKLEYRGL